MTSRSPAEGQGDVAGPCLHLVLVGPHRRESDTRLGRRPEVGVGGGVGQPLHGRGGDPAGLAPEDHQSLPCIGRAATERTWVTAPGLAAGDVPPRDRGVVGGQRLQPLAPDEGTVLILSEGCRGSGPHADRRRVGHLGSETVGDDSTLRGRKGCWRWPQRHCRRRRSRGGLGGVGLPDCCLDGVRLSQFTVWFMVSEMKFPRPTGPSPVDVVDVAVPRREAGLESPRWGTPGRGTWMFSLVDRVRLRRRVVELHLQVLQGDRRGEVQHSLAGDVVPPDRRPFLVG